MRPKDIWKPAVGLAAVLAVGHVTGSDQTPTEPRIPVPFEKPTSSEVAPVRRYTPEEQRMLAMWRERESDPVLNAAMQVPCNEVREAIARVNRSNTIDAIAETMGISSEAVQKALNDTQD